MRSQLTLRIDGLTRLMPDLRPLTPGEEAAWRRQRRLPPSRHISLWSSP